MTNDAVCQECGRSTCLELYEYRGKLYCYHCFDKKYRQTLEQDLKKIKENNNG